MSVLIKGMEMPKHCWQCPFHDDVDECILLNQSCMVVWGESKRLEDCPLVEAPKWIPVTERLPDNQCDVLCDDEGRVVVGYYTDEEIGYYTDEEIGWHDLHSHQIYPTHWMPLPKAPESEGE